MALLEIRDVVQDFGGVRALDGCSLDVAEGTVTGLIGPNGAGKTTLFNVVSGFLRPTAGEVLFSGERIDRLAAHDVFRYGIVRTFQIPHELKRMSVLENVLLVPKDQVGERWWASMVMPWAVRRQEKQLVERAREVLAFVGLEAQTHELAGNLSGGQKKLLEFARTLMAEPRLVLLDELGAGVNPTLMNTLVVNIERARKERGVTFFLIEHDMDLVMRLCDPVIVLSDGAKIAEGTPEQVQADERVLSAYLGG